MMSEDKDLTRREFVKHTAVAAGSLLLASPLATLAAEATPQNIPSRGYAAIDTSGKLVPWSFERRPLGDNDVLIDIKYASICHSDIHQMKGHWGRRSIRKCRAMKSLVSSQRWVGASRSSR